MRRKLAYKSWGAASSGAAFEAFAKTSPISSFRRRPARARAFRTKACQLAGSFAMISSAFWTAFSMSLRLPENQELSVAQPRLDVLRIEGGPSPEVPSTLHAGRRPRAEPGQGPNGQGRNWGRAATCCGTRVRPPTNSLRRVALARHLVGLQLGRFVAQPKATAGARPATARDSLLNKWTRVMDPSMRRTIAEVSQAPG